MNGSLLAFAVGEVVIDGVVVVGVVVSFEGEVPVVGVVASFEGEVPVLGVGDGVVVVPVVPGLFGSWL